MNGAPLRLDPVAELPAREDLPGWFVDAVDLRRDIHRRPELRFEERRTAALLEDRLIASGFEVVTRGIGGTGLVATLGRGRPHVVLRADMDALPIAEESSAEYRSLHDDAAHACGHDVHMTVVCAAAANLAADPPDGRVTVLMQPAEEIPFGATSGAAAVLDSGAIDFDTVDAVLGLHCWPWLPVGAIGVDAGAAMASKDAFQVRMRGRSSHAASPADGRDAILALSQAVTAMHALVHRERRPLDQLAFNVGTFDARFGQSVVAGEAVAVGTVRTLDEDLRGRVVAVIERVAGGTALAHGCEAEVTWANEMPAVMNDARLVDLAMGALAATPGVDVGVMDSPPMTTDDFALYAERAPGLYLKLGTANGPVVPLHNPSFDVDERAIWVGAMALETLARRLLGRGTA